MIKIPGSTIHRPGAAVLFIKYDADTATFLTQLVSSGGIHETGIFSFYDFTDLICDNV